MEFLSISQTAEKWGVTRRRVQVLCAEGRISGAMKVGTVWVIPASTEKPQDARVRSGRYVKNQEKPCNNDHGFGNIAEDENGE